MVENIGGIQPDRHAFGFADCDLLLNSHVGCPTAHVFKPVLAKIASISGKWRLQHDLAIGILDSIEGTKSVERCDHNAGIEALRVPHPRIHGLTIFIRKDIAGRVALFPKVVQGFDVKWPNDCLLYTSPSPRDS